MSESIRADIPIPYLKGLIKLIDSVKDPFIRKRKLSTVHSGHRITVHSHLGSFTIERLLFETENFFKSML